MVRLCERPGCSETGAVAYGMMPEHLLFWISPMADAPVDEPGVLCGRHADAMVVPRGWTLDDRREGALRLFRPLAAPAAADPPPRRVRRRTADAPRPEQLVIDGTGELPRPLLDDLDADPGGSDPGGPDLDGADLDGADLDGADLDGADPDRDDLDGADAVAEPTDGRPPATIDEVATWAPEFDHDDDLDGLLEVRSPLLARAFRGTDRPRR